MIDGTRLRAWAMALVPGAVVVVASLAAVAGLESLFRSWTFMLLAAAGALVAAAAAAVGTTRRLLVGETLAVGVIGLVVVGSLTCGGPATFFRGLTTGWADLLSATRPIDLPPLLRVVPLTLGWFATLVGLSLLRWSDVPALPVIGPLAALAVAVLLGGGGDDRPIVQGTVIAACGLLLGRLQQAGRLQDAAAAARIDLDAAATGLTDSRHGLGIRTGVMVGVVAIGAAVFGPALPFADANERYDLREELTSPWDPLAVPSPLVQLKASLREGRRDEPVFRVTSSQPIEHFALATLGEYDGVVWTVGSGLASARDEFRVVDRRLPDPPAEVLGGSSVDLTIEIVSLDGPWLPLPGWPDVIDPADGIGEVRANLRTGTVAVVAGLPVGSTFDIRATIPEPPSDEALLGSRPEVLPLAADLESLPPPVRNLAADYTEGRDLGWDQVVAVRDALTSTGFYDAGPAVPPGHSFFRLAEFLADPDRIVGYEEQYAAAAAVLLRVAQLPTRVVVGYEVPADRWTGGTAEVRHGDISAWVEVRIGDAGWIPVDMTPDRTRTPTADQQGSTVEDIAVPNPPPPPDRPPSVDVLTGDEEEPEEDEDDTDEDDSDEDESATAGPGWTPARIAATATAAVVGLFALFAATVIGLKVRRSRRRRRAARAADRISGSWFELADRCREARLPLPDRPTPRELASAVTRAAPSPDVEVRVESLVGRVERAAYHPRPPEPEEAVAAWGDCDIIVTTIVRQRGTAERVRMRLDPRGLRVKDPKVDA